MASNFPMIKNGGLTIVFPILDADGDPVTGAAADTPDSEYSLDGGSFTDCTNEIAELATNSGVYKLLLTAGETNGDVVAIQIKTATADTKTTVLVFYTSAQSLDTTDTAVDAIPTTAMRGTDNVVLAGPTKAEMDTAHALLATPAQVASELGTYDAPTKAEMDTAHALLATPAQVASELGTYDAPTKAEMDTGHGLLATEAKQDTIDTVVDGIQTDLSNVTDGLGALKSSIDAVPTAVEIQTEMEENGASILDTLQDRLTSARAGYLDNLSAGAVSLEATLTTMKQKVAGAFNRETDSLEALRDRGDSAWITGAGGDATEAKQDTIIGYLDTEIDAIKGVTDKLGDTLEDDAGTYRFTENALEQAPSGTGASAASIADAVWDETASEHVGSGSLGKSVKDIKDDLDDPNQYKSTEHTKL